MEQFKSLTLFLLLSFVLPGIIIITIISILYPDVRTYLYELGAFQLVSLVLVASFLNGPFACLIEHRYLEPLWEKMYKNFRLKERAGLLNRSKIIASAEANEISHAFYDQIFGEFLLFTNTSIWLIIISIPAFFVEHSNVHPIILVFIIGICMISLLFISPVFKKQYLDILDIIKERLDYVAKEGGDLIEK